MTIYVHSKIFTYVRDVELMNLKSELMVLRDNQSLQIKELTATLSHLSRSSSSLPDSRRNDQPVPPRSGTESRKDTPLVDEIPTRDDDDNNDGTPRSRTNVRSQETQVSRDLSKLERLEEDKLTYLGAGYTPEDDLIRLLQEQIDQLYKG